MGKPGGLPPARTVRTPSPVDATRAPVIFLSNEGGEIAGPFSVADLNTLWGAGEVPPDARYWHRGLAGWKPVGAFEQPNASLFQAAAHSVVLTTAPTVAGRDVERELEIVSAECVIGVNFLRDLAASVRDIVGGRSAAWQQQLRQAKNTCLTELRAEAHALWADAVIGVDLDYSEIGGQAKSMLMLVASGTAVRLRDEPPPVA